MSLGRCYAGHAFSRKLDMARLYGFHGIELAYEDLQDVAQQLPSKSEVHAAMVIRKQCMDRDIEILCLQPFLHYEGLVDRKKHLEHLEKLRHWFLLVKALGTDMIQIPSNFLHRTQVAQEFHVALDDLRKVADLGLKEKPPVRFSYEALCWGTRCNTWEMSWELVRRVDRPNFGLCLDTFNIAGRVYADPRQPKGCAVNCYDELYSSLTRLVATVDVRKVFYVQIVDAERLENPLVEGHEFYDAEQPAHMSWSRNCRLFYGETSRGGYLPIFEIANAIFNKLGYQGWVSMELFHRRMADKDDNVPNELASRGAAAWSRLVRDMKLVVDVKGRSKTKGRPVTR